MESSLERDRMRKLQSGIFSRLSNLIGCLDLVYITYDRRVMEWDVISVSIQGLEELFGIYRKVLDPYQIPLNINDLSSLIADEVFEFFSASLDPELTDNIILGEN